MLKASDGVYSGDGGGGDGGGGRGDDGGGGGRGVEALTNFWQILYCARVLAPCPISIVPFHILSLLHLAIHRRPFPADQRLADSFFAPQIARAVYVAVAGHPSPTLGALSRPFNSCFASRSCRDRVGGGRWWSWWCWCVPSRLAQSARMVIKSVPLRPVGGSHGTGA